MKPSGYQSYPSGFRSPTWGSPLLTITPDRPILQLMAKRQLALMDEGVWEFKADLIRETRRLFGDFRSWVEAQDHNVYISQSGYDFLADTIRFIKTGRRIVPLQSYTGIMEMERKHGSFHNDAADRRMTSLVSEMNFPACDYIHMWLSQPNGLDDMLCTVHYIFGGDVRKAHLY